jgi:nitroreductase
MAEFSQVLCGRRMVHSYRPDPVPDEVLERVVKVVHRAPSAGFSQGHRLAALSAVAQLPDDVALAGVITVGYPADDPGVPVAKLAKRRKPLDDLVSWLR